MFYSHEILTSRKYGVATVWLVATLGSKSNLKKINRKAILDVDVPKACETILAPEAPMALRLQSNLLYGVSRVYSQQCVYVLVDAQSAQSNMRALLKVARHADLDLEAGKTRPDQLVLQDDPGFLPDFSLPDLDLQLDALGASTQASSKDASILSAQSQPSSQSSHKDESLPGLVIPTSDTGNAGDLGGFQIPGSDRDSLQRAGLRDNLLEEEGGFFPDVDFGFDAEGNLVDLNTAQQAPETVDRSAAPRLGSDSAARAQVRQEHEEGLQAGQYGMGDAMDLESALRDMEAGAQSGALPAAEPFPETAAPAAGQQRFLKSTSVQEQEEELSDSAEAPLTRKRRGPRVLPMDATQELRASHLTNWNNNYVQNMAKASEQKLSHRIPHQAKKNAAAWVFGSGIGGVGVGLGSSKLPSPLDIFAGDKLMEALTGVELRVAGKKRGRSDEEGQESESEGRRTRPRSDEGEQVGRGDDLMLDDNDLPPLFEDTNIEVGREAAPLLEEHSSQMPWNISASVHGSRPGSVARGRGFPSSLAGFPTSAGGPSSLPPLPTAIPGSFDRRASRLTSASPLTGRGAERFGSLELPSHEDDEELLGGRIISDDQALNEFQFHGPAAAVDTQTAAQSQWLKATLNQESTNFLEFVKAQIETRPAGAREDEGELAGDEAEESVVIFEKLLPPGEHSKLVAAQAFHHILALATKGLVRVEQDVGYGPIRLGIRAGV